MFEPDDATDPGEPSLWSVRVVVLVVTLIALLLGSFVLAVVDYQHALRFLLPWGSPVWRTGLTVAVAALMGALSLLEPIDD